jgi:hypothetical protein
MKSIVTLILLIPTFIYSQSILEDFEVNRNISYGFAHGLFDPPIYGSKVQPTTNPDQSGVNTSALCAKYSKNPNPNDSVDVIIFNPHNKFSDVSDYISGEKTITLDVWSDNPNTSVVLTFEKSNIALADNYPTGRHSIFTASTSLTSSWETLTFTFYEQPDPTVSDFDLDQGVILFNQGVFDNITVYFDNLIGPSPDCGENFNLNILEDFECNRKMDYTYSHGNLVRKYNPDPVALNDTEYVGEYIRSDFKASDVIISNFTQPFVLEDNQLVSINIWSSVSKEFRISLQDEIGAIDGEEGVNFFDKTVTLTGSSAWEKYTFDFSNIPNNVNITQAVLLFAPDETGFPYTFYYDNLAIETSNNTKENANSNKVSILNNELIFDNLEGTKIISVYDVSARLLEKSTTFNNNFPINHKGFVLIYITDDYGVSHTIKHLNN